MCVRARTHAQENAGVRGNILNGSLWSTKSQVRNANRTFLIFFWYILLTSVWESSFLQGVPFEVSQSASRTDCDQKGGCCCEICNTLYFCLNPRFSSRHTMEWLRAQTLESVAGRSGSESFLLSLSFSICLDKNTSFIRVALDIELGTQYPSQGMNTMLSK